MWVTFNKKSQFQIPQNGLKYCKFKAIPLQSKLIYLNTKIGGMFWYLFLLSLQSEKQYATRFCIWNTVLQNEEKKYQYRRAACGSRSRICERPINFNTFCKFKLISVFRPLINVLSDERHLHAYKRDIKSRSLFSDADYGHFGRWTIDVSQWCIELFRNCCTAKAVSWRLHSAGSCSGAWLLEQPLLLCGSRPLFVINWR